MTVEVFWSKYAGSQLYYTLKCPTKDLPFNAFLHKMNALSCPVVRLNKSQSILGYMVSA